MGDPLGKIAYEAFTKELGAHCLEGLEREGPWSKLPRKAQQAWDIAAREVVREAIREARAKAG